MAHLTKDQRIQMLTDALTKIDNQCRPYDSMSQMGYLGSTAREAILAAGETIGEKCVRWDKARQAHDKLMAKLDAQRAKLGLA